MSRAWKGKWICTAEFSELIPRNVYDEVVRLAEK